VALASGGLVAATQYEAATFRYAKPLGPPALTIQGLRLYVPWAAIDWAARFAKAAPITIRNGQMIVAAGCFLGLVAFLLSARLSAGPPPPSTSHGSARWATDEDLSRVALLPPEGKPAKGIVLCQTADAHYVFEPHAEKPTWRLTKTGRLLSHDGPEHAITFAPTRSGKGIGTVIPTGLTWQGSVIAHDIKKELWNFTAGHRRKFSYCWRFEPSLRAIQQPDGSHVTAKETGVRYNPLFEVRKGDKEVSDAQTIAEILIDPDGKGERDHWKLSGASLLTGAILHVLYAEADKSLRGLGAFLSDPSRTQFEMLERMLKTNHLELGPHPVVAQVAREMLNKSDNELSGVISTAKAALTLYADPNVGKATEVSDFVITDLMNLDRPVSLYIVVPPSDIDRLRPLTRVMLNQIGKRLTEHMSFDPKEKTYRHRMLMLLDEFPQLGRLPFFESGLAYCAGYGIKCFLICQSLNQLDAAYGQNNSILDNCHVRLTYTANDERTAKRISDLCGQRTVSRVQKSRSNVGLFGARSINLSDQEFARPLLTPDEVLSLPYEEAILYVAGSRPYRGAKVMYYLDPRFSPLVDRGRAPPPDSPEEQRAELPKIRRMSPWATLPPIYPANRPMNITAPSLGAASAEAPPPDAGPVIDWAAMLPPGPPDEAAAGPAEQADAGVLPRNDAPLL